MVRSVVGIRAHNNDYHSGSAARDIASGVAGLDASGHVLAKGSAMQLIRDGLNRIYVMERTSAEYAVWSERLGANDYAAYVRESAASRRIQTESMKNAALGIAGLDAAAKVALAQIPDLSSLYDFSAYTDGVDFVDGTIYQNTSGKAKIITMQCLSAGTWTLNVDSVTPPVNTIFTGVNGYNISFPVPDGYYYRITNGTSQYVTEAV